jgi:hypothetical protein
VYLNAHSQQHVGYLPQHERGGDAGSHERQPLTRITHQAESGLKRVQVQSVRRAWYPVSGVYTFEELIERHHDLETNII